MDPLALLIRIGEVTEKKHAPAFARAANVPSVAGQPGLTMKTEPARGKLGSVAMRNAPDKDSVATTVGGELAVTVITVALGRTEAPARMARIVPLGVSMVNNVTRAFRNETQTG